MSVLGVILVRIFLIFSYIRTEYEEILRISPYSVRMQKNVGKMMIKITPNTDTFYAVIEMNSEYSLQLYKSICHTNITCFTNFTEASACITRQ